MTSTPASRPAWKGQPQPKDLAGQLLQQLPDEIVFNTRQVMPGQTNLELAASAFETLGLKPPTQADLDAEAARRNAANRDPQADPSPGDGVVLKPRPGDQGRAMAARRFGAKP